MQPLKKINSVALSLLMLISFAFITPSMAATLTVTNVTLPSGTPFNLSITGGYFGSTTRTVTAPYAGQILLQTTQLGTIGTWCVDDLHTIYLGGQYNYTAGLLQTNNAGNTLATSTPLSSQQIHDVLALATYGNDLISTYALGTARDMFSGQIQAAIWGVIYNAAVTASGADVNGFSAATFNTAVTDLRALAPSLSTGTAIALYNLSGSGKILSQVLVGTHPQLSQFVPEPTTISLLAIGLVGFMSRKRKLA